MGWLGENWWNQNALPGILNNSINEQQIWIGTREKAGERKKGWKVGRK